VLLFFLQLHVETLYRIAKTLIEWQNEEKGQRSKKKGDSAKI